MGRTYESALRSAARVSSTAARLLAWEEDRAWAPPVPTIRDTWPEIVQAARDRGLRPDLEPQLPGRPELFAVETAKTRRGEPLGYLTGICYMAPHQEATVPGVTLCPRSTAGCRAVCLAAESGRMRFPASRNARVWRTALFMADRMLWRAALLRDAARVRDFAARGGLRASVRVDGGSDTGEGWRLGEVFDRLGVRRYDYTKNVSRARVDRWAVFSHRGDVGETTSALGDGVRAAAVVFAGELPPRWHGFEVVDGDIHDLRFLELGRRRKPFVFGLRFKGPRSNLASAGSFVEGSADALA